MLTLKHRTIKLAAVASAALLFASTSAFAQKTTDMGAGNGGSAHVKTEWTIGNANISISYGRPTLKGRPDATMMPVGKPWRAGSDAATILTTDKPVKFGTITVQPGSYTINTEPGETEWKFILGKLGAPDQWGIPYKPELEIGRVPMKLTKNAKPAEMVTISIDPLKDGGTLHIQWGTKDATVPFSIVK